MDPMSALSIAAGVFQFVDFGRRLLSDTADNYRAPGRHQDDLERLDRDLTALNAEVQSKSHLATGASEQVLIRACNTCAELAKELKRCISDVAHTNKTAHLAQSFLSALLKGRSESEINTLRTRLGSVQQEMMVAVLVHLWYVVLEKPSWLAGPDKGREL